MMKDARIYPLLAALVAGCSAEPDPDRDALVIDTDNFNNASAAQAPPPADVTDRDDTEDMDPVVDDAPTDVVDPNVDDVEDALTPPADVGLHIAFDYRFDRSGFFASAEAKGVLEAAARMWGVWLRDDFDTIVAGTPLYTRDPEDPAQEPFIDIEHDIDDILVFVGSAPRDGSYAGSSATAAFPAESDDPELRAALYARWDSLDNYEPWTGWMSFDTDRDWFFDETPHTADDIPADAVDAVSIALHELGHILGISPGDAFMAHVVDGHFTGPHAMEVYGGPVPLAGDGYGHIADHVRVDGRMPLMATGKPQGVRYEPTRLDLAILADIGYELP